MNILNPSSLFEIKNFFQALKKNVLILPLKSEIRYFPKAYEIHIYNRWRCVVAGQGFD